MGQRRKPITPVQEGRLWVARFKHPVLNRVVRFSLGEGESLQTNFDALNDLFLLEANWYNPPKTTPEFILRQWPSEVVKLKGNEVRKGQRRVGSNSAELA